MNFQNGCPHVLKVGDPGLKFLFWWCGIFHFLSKQAPLGHIIPDVLMGHYPNNYFDIGEAVYIAVRTLFTYLGTVLGRIAIIFDFILTGMLPFKYLAEALSKK